MQEADSTFSNVDDFILRLHNLRKERLAAKMIGKGKRKSLTKKQRNKVFEKTGRHCHICGGMITGDWVADHVYAHAYGGEHVEENYLPAHKICNRSKWFYGAEEFQWILKLGVYFRTQLEEIGNPSAVSLAQCFLEYERHRDSRRKKFSISPNKKDAADG